jgi:CBS domain-containing protein
MTPWPEFVFPETEIVEAARLMCHLEVGALPVCDGDRLVGIVTDRDIVVRHIAEGGCTQLVGSIMTPNPYTVGPDEPIERAEALMAEHRVRRLPVCEGGRLVGIVSQGDLARHASHEEVGALVEAISTG